MTAKKRPPGKPRPRQPVPSTDERTPVQRAIDRTIERAASQLDQPGETRVNEIKLLVLENLIAFAPSATGRIVIPPQSPEGPHVLVWMPGANLWQGVRLPLGTEWLLSISGKVPSEPSLWTPGRPQ